jgi:hypothetical protein
MLLDHQNGSAEAPSVGINLLAMTVARRAEGPPAQVIVLAGRLFTAAHSV